MSSCVNEKVKNKVKNVRKIPWPCQRGKLLITRPLVSWSTYLTPIRLGTPSDCAHAMILFIFTSFNGFKAFGRISILIMANIALQTAHCNVLKLLKIQTPYCFWFQKFSPYSTTIDKVSPKLNQRFKSHVPIILSVPVLIRLDFFSKSLLLIKEGLGLVLSLCLQVALPTSDDSMRTGNNNPLSAWFHTCLEMLS